MQTLEPCNSNTKCVAHINLEPDCFDCSTLCSSINSKIRSVESRKRDEEGRGNVRGLSWRLRYSGPPSRRYPKCIGAIPGPWKSWFYRDLHSCITWSRVSMLSKASDHASEIAMHRSAAGGTGEGRAGARVRAKAWWGRCTQAWCPITNPALTAAEGTISFLLPRPLVPYPSLLFARGSSYFGHYVIPTERDTTRRRSVALPERADRRNRKLIENARSFETGHDQFRV